MNMHVAIAVVDAAEVTRVLLASDSYTRGWIKQVQDLAHTVIKTGMSSGAYAKSLNNDFNRIRAAVAEDNQILAMPGGVPIYRNGKVVGAVSVAGNDPSAYGNLPGPVEPCATAGRELIEAGLH
jgi:uncharacterized protein GlcG (DUF336 family)